MLDFDVIDSNEKPKIRQSRDAYSYLLKHWGVNKNFFEETSDKSKLNALILNTDDTLICGLSFHPKHRIRQTDFEDFFKIVKEYDGAKVFLGLNHPNKDIFPTEREEELAIQFKQMGAKEDVTVVDQLILSGATYFSFANNGF